MKRVLLAIALALILVQVGAYAPTVTLIMTGDTGKMFLPNGWNLNEESLEEKINLALALNREGCYSSGYYLFNHERECLLWLSFPVYANSSLYSESSQVKLIGILRVYGGTKSVVVRRVSIEGKQWIEFAAENGAGNTGQYSYQYTHKPKQATQRHYSYLTTSYHPSASRTSKLTIVNQASYFKPRTVRHYVNITKAGHASYSRSRSSANYASIATPKHAGYLTPTSQSSTRHYSHYSRTGSQTTIRHYAYYSPRPAIRTWRAKTGNKNTYSRYYRRAGSNWLVTRLE